MTVRILFHSSINSFNDNCNHLFYMQVLNFRIMQTRSKHGYSILG